MFDEHILHQQLLDWGLKAFQTRDGIIIRTENKETFLINYDDNLQKITVYFFQYAFSQRKEAGIKVLERFIADPECFSKLYQYTTNLSGNAIIIRRILKEEDTL